MPEATIKWAIAIIAIEAVTEIVVNGEIFFKFRDWIHRHNSLFLIGFVSDLISCGYCFSVWVSFAAAWTLPKVFDHTAINIAITTFCLHRLANVCHELINRWLKRVPFITRNSSQMDYSVFDDEMEEEDGTTLSDSDKQDGDLEGIG